MKKTVFVVILLLFSLSLSSSWAQEEDIADSTKDPTIDIDYIVLDVSLQNFDAEPEVDGLKVRIYYMNRYQDSTVSWELPNTIVDYAIFKPQTRDKDFKEDLQILQDYDRISYSGERLYIRLSPDVQSFGNGVLLVTVQFPNGNTFAAKTKVKLSP